MAKRKTHYARRDWIFLSLVILFALSIVFSGACLDATGALFKTKNPIAKFGRALGLPSVNSSGPAWILLLCLVLYFVLAVAAVLFEFRMAEFYDHCHWNKKWATVYGVTILIALVLSFGIGCVAQYPFTAEYFHNSFLFVGEALAMSVLLFGALGLALASVVVLILNLRKPKTQEEPKKEDEAEDEETDVQKEKPEEKAPLAASFGDVTPSVAAGLMQQYDEKAASLAKQNFDREKVFPGLCKIDYEEAGLPTPSFHDEGDLQSIAEGFRNYLAKDLKLYFPLESIRAFIAGLHASRLLILQGLSGTGKSSLARYWSEYIGEESFFEPVQATWRDRTSLLGYYNDFSSSYHETDFLKRLYRASYETERQNVMVLDELNISRVEYYFADFLSILEYPSEQWRLKILELPVNAEPPAHLENGILSIPGNTWFIGTANTDDSTFTITDKVVDRAILLDFDERNEPFAVEGEAHKISLSYSYLNQLFLQAEAQPEYAFTNEDYLRFKGLLDFVDETFGIAIGNRILHQITLFVPVYMAEGGKKNEALDFMFAEKVLSKLKGRYEDYVSKGMIELRERFEKLYGSDFVLSSLACERILKKLL
jgi:hypothetical protein